ncbi:MAG: hypothetical protein H6Q11_1452, partial [Acidobacteria bacterium]|nr:hypothetical protein [Acidobacteriota bacterium]
APEAFEEAFKALLRTWHHYEVARALGAPGTPSARPGVPSRRHGVTSSVAA